MIRRVPKREASKSKAKEGNENLLKSTGVGIKRMHPHRSYTKAEKPGEVARIRNILKFNTNDQS